MRRLLVIALLAASCDEVTGYQMESCRKMCAPRPVERCSSEACECEKAHPPGIVDAIERLAK